MDDFNEDFGDDFDDGGKDNFDHDDDDSVLDDIFDENEIEDEVDADKDVPLEAESDPCEGLQWQSFMIIGPLSEEIAREKKERERLRRRLMKGK